MKYILTSLVVTIFSTSTLAVSKEVVDQYKEIGYLQATAPLIQSLAVTVNGKAARSCNKVSDLQKLTHSQEFGSLVAYVRSAGGQDGTVEYLNRLDNTVKGVCDNSLTNADS